MRQLNDGARLRTAPALVPAALAGSVALIFAAAPAPAGAEERATGSRSTTIGSTGLGRIPVPASPLPALRVPASPPSAAAVALRVPAGVVRAAAVPLTYTVQRGDTVYAIATRFGLRTADVLALNGLTWTSIIRPGQVLRLTGAAAAAPAAPAAPAPSGRTYTVQKGDTLSAIAARNGVSVQTLFAANGMGWRSIIYPGQKILLGAAAAPAAQAAPAAPASPAARPPAAASGTYTVQKGDTLSSIASRHGVSVQTLFAANGLGWNSIIYPGEKIALAVAPPPAPAAPALVPHPITALDAEQTANAQLIIRVGRSLGVPDRGLAIALGAAMQESGLRNVAYGDRDSLGLFQQRPSAGWGTAAEVSDPERAARAFFGGPSDPNGRNTRGLLDIPGWQNLAFGDAAQAVQISAHPELYGLWEPAARAWLASLG